MGLSNGSLPYLNYPTQVMFKCCKLIPVLIGGILIQGKVYNIYDMSASVMMSLGLILFTLADVQVQPSFQMIGVVLITGALIADAAIGNVQEKQMKTYKASNVEVSYCLRICFVGKLNQLSFKVVLYSYSIGFVYILIGELLFGNFFQALRFWFLVFCFESSYYGFYFY